MGFSPHITFLSTPLDKKVLENDYIQGKMKQYTVIFILTTNRAFLKNTLIPIGPICFVTIALTSLTHTFSCCFLNRCRPTITSNLCKKLLQNQILTLTENKQTNKEKVEVIIQDHRILEVEEASVNKKG